MSPQRRLTRAEIAAIGTTTPPEQSINRGHANNGCWSQAGQTPLSNITPLNPEPVIARAVLKPVQARLSLDSVGSHSDSDDENVPPTTAPTTTADTSASEVATSESSSSFASMKVGLKKEYLYKGQWWAVKVTQVLQKRQRVVVEVEEFAQEDTCLVCGESTEECAEEVLICDQCDGENHLPCSGLNRVPRGQWLCRGCDGVLNSAPSPLQNKQRISIPLCDLNALRDRRRHQRKVQEESKEHVQAPKKIRSLSEDERAGGVLSMLTTEARVGAKGSTVRRQQSKGKKKEAEVAGRPQRTKTPYQQDSLQFLSKRGGLR